MPLSCRYMKLPASSTHGRSSCAWKRSMDAATEAVDGESSPSYFIRSLTRGSRKLSAALRSSVRSSLRSSLRSSFSSSRGSSHYCDIEIDLDLDLYSFASELGVEEGAVVTDDQGGEGRVPEKEKGKGKESRLSVILLDQGLFTVYKRLFLLVSILNAGAIAAAASDVFPYAASRRALFSMINILVLTLCRSEAFLRIVFWLSVKTLGRPWVPLFIKTFVTSILQSLGGIHSGCGVSSIAWLVYGLIPAIRDHADNRYIALSIAILLVVSCLAAFPLLRHLHHNAFERTHRFAGWAALALLWAYVISSHDGLDNALGHQQLFITLAITGLTALPWVTIKKVSVTVETASGHASVINFQGGIHAGLLGRISRSWLLEWHAFGTISDGKDNHIMLAGAVGDFTKELVLSPPTHLWVRGIRFAGLPYLVNLYRRVLLVATGSGICVFLSNMLQPTTTSICLLWVAKSVEQNFGRDINDIVRRLQDDDRKNKVIVHDTAVAGRPNIAEMTVAHARDWNAEVVIVTSNPEGSRDVVNAC